jgi:hypothetical protein
MSNRFERESERGSEGRSSASMMHLLGQMFMLPFTIFVYGMEAFVQTIKGFQRAADQGMDVMAGGATPPRDFSLTENHPADQTVERISNPSPQGGQRDINVSTTTSTSDSKVGDAGASDKETIEMNDRNLSDDQLKLVRFKMTGEAFTAWKVAEFIQELGKGITEVPAEWSRDDQGKPKYPKEPGALTMKDSKWYLMSFPEKDKKYLRVYYEVLDRYVREEEDDEVVVLKEIRDAIDRIPKGSGGVTSP